MMDYELSSQFWNNRRNSQILKLQNFQSKFDIQKMVSKGPNMHVPDAWTLDDNMEQGL